MRGLRKYLTPFAPDQSGAVSVLYEFGGIIAICDAGGCTGNICGFDEPRWFESKSALFSAGLRDMDAILGRDDRLVAKLADAVTKLDAKFAAIIDQCTVRIICCRLVEESTAVRISIQHDLDRIQNRRFTASGMSGEEVDSFIKRQYLFIYVMPIIQAYLRECFEWLLRLQFDPPH